MNDFYINDRNNTLLKALTRAQGHRQVAFAMGLQCSRAVKNTYTIGRKKQPASSVNCCP